MTTNRRGFLLGLGAIIAAPAIVRVSSIMPVKVLVQAPELDDLVPLFSGEMGRYEGVTIRDIHRAMEVMKSRQVPELPAGGYVAIVHLKAIPPL